MTIISDLLSIFVFNLMQQNFKCLKIMWFIKARNNSIITVRLEIYSEESINCATIQRNVKVDVFKNNTIDPITWSKGESLSAHLFLLVCGN